MGSDRMENTLMFLAYLDSSGQNITLSPRLSYDEVEPSYTGDVKIDVLSGSEHVNGTMKVNARCTNCRSWKGGSIDPKNTAAEFIFAAGPSGDLRSDSLSANTKRHSQYGAFVMDLTKAVGEANVPDDIDTSSIGSSQTQNQSDSDWSEIGHAALMILTFVGLMPLAVGILRLSKSPRWHGFTQTVSVVIALAGTAIGIKMGLTFNRVGNIITD